MPPMIPLHDLEPRLLRHTLEEGRQVHHVVDTLAESQGIMILCPLCYQANGGAMGTHAVLCWFRDRGVPDEAVPGPARWQVSGASLEDLTLHPSVLLLGGCRWHGWVQNGRALLA